MVSISHTKIKSESKKYKGQWYPKFYVNSPNWNIPKRPRYRSILFYYRADTPEKKKQNTQSQKLLNAIYKELKEQYKGAEYREGQESNITLKNHLDRMIRLKEGSSSSQVRTFKNLKSSLEAFCMANGYNINMDINRVNLIFCDDYRFF